MYSLPQSYNQTSKCKRCISSNAYDETSKVLSLEFLEYIGEVRVSVVDANGNIVYEEIVDTQDVSSSIISLDECTSGSYGLYISDSENYAEGFFNL